MRPIKVALFCALLNTSTHALSIVEDTPASLERRAPKPQEDEEEEIYRTTTIIGAPPRPPYSRPPTSIITMTVTSRPTYVTTVTISRPRTTTIYGGGPQNGQGRCPQVWTQISRELSPIFYANGECTNEAHGAIRAVFHDCFPNGGCDGSLAIDQELNRPLNAPMREIVVLLRQMAQRYGVSNADMLAFAGSHAIVTCPGGPLVRTYIGRQDSGRPTADGQLITAFAAGRDALNAFRNKGFSAQELAALIGAHTVSRQRITDPQRVGLSQDTTPGIWDTNYFVQTLVGTAPFTFQSDSNLKNDGDVGPWMAQFATDKSGWDRVFTAAMTKMEFLGTRGANSMVDCTSALPAVRPAPRVNRIANITEIANGTAVGGGLLINNSTKIR